MVGSMTYEYLCSEGHHIVGRHHQEFCLAVVKGQPCPGTLKRIGEGSRTQEVPKR